MKRMLLLSSCAFATSLLGAALPLHAAPAQLCSPEIDECVATCPTGDLGTRACANLLPHNSGCFVSDYQCGEDDYGCPDPGCDPNNGPCLNQKLQCYYMQG